MNIRSTPDTAQKFELLADATRFEPAGDSATTEIPVMRRSKPLPCVTEVSTPGGKKPILKTMVTTACEKNCYYCPFRAGRSSTTRVTLKPDEIASTFDQMQRAGVADGLFLSSGIIKGGVSTQDKIIDTVDLIRHKYHYRGYVHLKIMPGAEYDQVYRAMQLADRVSINLEGATSERLHALAPKKDFGGDLLERLAWAQQIKTESGGRIRASMSTQFVVGAVGDTDQELLSTSSRLYRQLGLKRAYYSAFSPVRDTPFENLSPVAALRERRLYQSSFLIRDYGWDVDDLPFVENGSEQGNLALDVDPKRAWADRNLRHNPLDVMTASRAELLRIPGIGPRNADLIVAARQRGHLTELAHLRTIGVRAPEQAAPYILLDGHAPLRQLSLGL